VGRERPCTRPRGARLTEDPRSPGSQRRSKQVADYALLAHLMAESPRSFRRGSPEVTALADPDHDHGVRPRPGSGLPGASPVNRAPVPARAGSQLSGFVGMLGISPLLGRQSPSRLE
jgi:hypothetical protein